VPLSRRALLAGLGAIAAPLPARADELPAPPCRPPDHQRRIDRRWRRLPDDVQSSGFVSYFAERFPFAARIAPGMAPPRRTLWPEDQAVPSCAATEPNRLLEARGSLARAILGAAPSELCQHLPGEPLARFERTARALRYQLFAALAEAPDAVVVPVGAHHSCSGAYRPPSFDGAIAVDAGGINDVVPLGRGPGGRPLVLCGAGATICQLNEALWGLGLALPTVGSFDAQQLAGAIATGTHGSAAEVGALGDCVVAMVVLCAPSAPGGAERWRFLQIQAGLDDVPLLAPAERIVADPGLLEAFVVSVGLLGVVVGVVIEARRRFWLHRRRYARRWREVRPEMVQLGAGPPAGVRGRGWRYELAINPAPVSRPFRGPADGVAGEPEWVAQEWMHDEWGQDDDTEDILTLDALDRRLASAQERFDLRLFPSMAVSRQMFGDESGELIDRGYRVLRLEWSDSVRAWGTEWHVPVEHGTEVVDWLLRRNHALGPHHDDRLVLPFSVRFAPSRRGWLCPSRFGPGRTACTVEPAVPVRSCPGANAESRRILARWAEAFLAESDRRGWSGRLHWGLVNDPFGRAALEAAYPEVDAWREVFLAFNRRGRFDTTLARQLGLDAWRDEQADRATAYDEV
jgi:hypothetical protein